jgi:hypothetical protein
MITKFTNAMAIIIKLGEAALLVALIILCLRVSDALKAVSASTSAISTLAQNTDKQLNGTSAQHGTDGAIFAAKKAIDDVRAGSVLASRQEVKYFATLQTNTDAIVSRVNGNMDELKFTMKSLNDSQLQIAKDAHETFGNVNVSLLRLPPLLDQGTKTLGSAQHLFDDPSIPFTLQHLASTSAHVDDISGSMVKVSASTALAAQDAQESFHKWLHPSRKEIVWGYVWKSSEIFGARLVP